MFLDRGIGKNCEVCIENECPALRWDRYGMECTRDAFDDMYECLKCGDREYWEDDEVLAEEEKQ